MFSNYTDKQKMAVIAVVKGIIFAHGHFEGEELAYIKDHVNEDNFPDYSEKFIEFEKKYQTESSILEAFAEVEDEKVREELIDLALNLAAASGGVIDPKEVDVINHMCEIWGYEHKIVDSEENN